MRAAELFRENKLNHSEIARGLGVSPVSVMRWHRNWVEKGKKGLKSLGPNGRKSRLTPKDLDRVRKGLLKGPLAFGFENELWTLPRVSKMIVKITGEKYSEVQTWRILRQLGFSPQKPRVQAIERDEARIKTFVDREIPRIKKSQKTGSNHRLHG